MIFSKIAQTACIVFLSSAISQAQPTTAPVDYSIEKFRLVNQPDEIVSVLGNNLTVIAKHVESPVVAVRAYAQTGGVYEGKWLGGGLSHLLEHLTAGGTNARRSEAENRNLLQQIGNDSNAYTTYDHTCFYVNTTSEHLDQAVDLVSGWMLGASITPEEYAREYQVVQRELEMNKGEPDSVFWNLIQRNRYRISPARVPVIGYQEVIQSLSRDDVYSYYKLAYQPNNLVFSVAGNLDPQTMLDAVRTNVKSAPPGREFSHDLTPEPPVLAPRTLVASFPKLGQSRLDLSFPSVREDDPDLYALDLLSSILGGGESSILTQSLRDDKQLVSEISASDNTPSYVAGSFSITAQLDRNKIPAVVDAVFSQIDALKNQPIDADRIARAKTQIRAAHVKGLQTSEDVAAALATDFISTGDPHFSDRYVDRIDKVTAEQLADVAGRYLLREHLLTTSLLPAEDVAASSLQHAEDLLRPVAPTTKPVVAQASDAITRIELPNGIVLLHKRISTSPIVEVRMYALGGVTAEDASTSGIGNLTMEMLPRGTSSRSAQQIAEYFDSIGGTLDTSCGNNTWSWNLTCMGKDLPQAMPIYADVVNSPAFADAELSQMKTRLDAAVDSQDADWQEQGMRFFRKEYFGPQHSPYQFLPLGEKTVIDSATSGQLRKWYSEKILNAPRVLAIFGDVDLDEAKSLASQYFSSPPVNRPLPRDYVATAQPNNATPHIDVDRIEVQKTDQPLASVVIGFNSADLVGEPDAYAMTLIDTITSGYGYPTGYLFETLRGRGLVYVADAYVMPGIASPGAFIAYAGCDPKNVNEVIELMLQNIARCQGSDVDMQPDWFGRAKQLVTVGQAMENQTAAQQATLAALDELQGLGFDYHAHFAEKVSAVPLEKVRAIARARLSSCVITVSTPLPDAVDKKAGERTYDSFPEIDLTPRGVQHDVGK